MKSIKDVLDIIVDIAIKAKHHFSKQDLIRYSKGWNIDTTISNLEKIMQYQEDMPEECHRLIDLYSNQNFENNQQVNEFIDKLNDHINCGNPINESIRSKTIELAYNEEFRPKVIEFVNKAIHQGYDFGIEKLASFKNCAIEECFQCLPNLLVSNTLSEEKLEEVQEKFKMYIEMDALQNLPSYFIDILRVGLQYEKKICTSDQILSLIKNESIENLVRLKLASILAYYDDCKKYLRKAFSVLKLDEITGNKQIDISAYYYMNKYQVELDKIDKNANNTVHEILINLIISRSEATGDEAILFKHSIENFYEKHKENYNKFDLIMDSIFESIIQMLDNVGFDRIKELLDHCSDENFDWRLIYACQSLEYENKYEFIKVKCMTNKLKKYGIIKNFSQNNLIQFCTKITKIGWSLKSIQELFVITRKHKSQWNFIEFLDFVDKYEFSEIAVMKLANRLEIRNSKRNTAFLQDLTNLLIQIKILEAIYKLKPNETTDLVGIRNLLLHWVYQINWSLEEVFMMISKFEDIDDNDIITVIEQSLSLIIAYKLKLDSEIDDKSLRDIIENDDIDDWYKCISDLGLKIWFKDSQIKQKDQIEKELVETNSNQRVIKFAKTKLLLHLNQIERLRDFGRSVIASIQKPISQWSLGDIKNWAAKIKDSGKLAVMNNIEEVYAVICQAVKSIEKYYPRNTQITTVLLSSLESKSSVLHQVSTGEGKTLTIAIHAIILCLFGHKVDIVTSSEVLARRDSKDMKNLYMMFNIKVSHNWYNVTGNKIWYDSDVVYGDIKNFQGDHLRHHFKKDNTRNDRKYEKVIIDEVDNMLLDNAHHITMLSDQHQGFDELDILIRRTWSIFLNFHEGFFKVQDKTCWSKSVIKSKDEENKHQSVSYKIHYIYSSSNSRNSIFGIAD